MTRLPLMLTQERAPGAGRLSSAAASALAALAVLRNLEERRGIALASASCQRPGYLAKGQAGRLKVSLAGQSAQDGRTGYG